MKRHKFPFIVTSNTFLLFPMIAALYVDEWFYFVFSILLFVASVGFHYTFYHNKKDFSLSRFLFKRKKHKSERFFRFSDWILASTGAGYIFYYIYNSKAEINIKWFFAICFSLTLLFFIYTFKIGDYNKTHPWFHVLAQTLLGFIVLFL